MYENLIRKKDLLTLLSTSGRDRLRDHSGSYRQFIRSHERHAALCIAGVEGIDPIPPRLFARFADSRTMFAATEDLRNGGRAAGPNGSRLLDWGRSETWALCRVVAKSIRRGTYHPGPRRSVRVPKASGGKRKLEIQNIEDRIVDRALLRILQPVVDPIFSPFSFGFRPRIRTLNAVASGLALARTQHLWFWVTADVANAFDAIPVSRLAVICRQYLPKKIAKFVERITASGLAQGSPISPLLFNLFFHHFLDRPWQRRHPSRPLIRYADDLAVMAGSRTEAEELRGCLVDLARSAGTPLKAGGGTGIFDISGGQTVDWLGFRYRRDAKRLAIRLSNSAWTNLEFAFAEAHLEPAAPLRAIQIVRGWLCQGGPCFRSEDTPAVATRILEIGAASAFEELPSENELVADWQRAYERWRCLYRREQKSLTGRLASWSQQPLKGGPA